MRPALLLLLLAGCPKEPEPDPEPSMADVPTAECGITPYTWVDEAQVGTVVTFERASELDASADLLRTLLSQGGYPVERLPITYDVEMYRMRYTTQDRGRVVEATALVSFPDADGSFPTVAWLHGTTGFSDDCAPSDGIAGAAGNLLLSSLGAVVVAPDYLGMNGFGDPSDMLHPYVVAEPTAIASLDAIRAAWAAETTVNTDASSTRTTVLFGGSEGGFAALWSERYAPYYLPDADIVGTVASVPPSDVVGLAEHGVDVLGATSGGTTAVLVAHHDWYGYDAPLTDVLVPDLAASLPELMNETCGDGGAFDDVETLEDVFSADALEGFSDFEPWICGLEANSLATATFPRISASPVLYVISGADELVWHETNRADVPRLCDQGYDLDVIECAGASHSEGAVTSLHLQWRWVEARLAGEPLAGGTCTLPTPIDCASTN